MKELFFLLLFSVMVLFGRGQTITPELLGFESHEIIDADLGSINYYLTPNGDGPAKPLLVYLDGSGAYPLFQQMTMGIGSTVVLDYQSLSAEYRVLLISKPGVPFIDSVSFDETGFPQYDTPEEYTNKLSLFSRVNAADAIINKLVKEKTVDPNRVVVLGFSEGAQVGPFLAEKNKHVSHLMLFGGNGLHQFLDPLITARQQAINGQMTEVEAQATVDSLFRVYEDIYSHPTSTDAQWYGHSYLRWASFNHRAPLDALAALDIPIYIANGSRDENSVLSADYIKLEFIRLGKRNLTYHTYPGYDHQFNELIIEKGVFKEAIPRLNDVMSDAFGWLSTAAK